MDHGGGIPISGRGREADTPNRVSSTGAADDPRGELGLTQFTQPALYVVNAMTYRARLEDGESAPGFVAGHSLGEYNALQAAGVCDFATGLAMVKRRGAIMGKVSGGGMAAIIGMPPEKIQELLQTSDAGRTLDVANFNSFDQTVVAGPTDAIATVKPQFEAAGVKLFVPLKVSAPFHSRYMRDPQAQFSGFLDQFTLAAPGIPVISNATARPYDAASVKATLASQIGSPVKWLDSMLYLMEKPEPTFEEVGPGQVLSKLLKQIQKRRAQG